MRERRIRAGWPCLIHDANKSAPLLRNLLQRSSGFDGFQMQQNLPHHPHRGHTERVPCHTAPGEPSPPALSLPLHRAVVTCTRNPSGTVILFSPQ